MTDAEELADLRVKLALAIAAVQESNLTALQVRGNELLEEARAARAETRQERAHVRHLQTDVTRLRVGMLDYAARLDESQREAEDLGRRLKAAQDLIEKASKFAMKVCLRRDNPPAWTSEARTFSNELEAARS